eukprot:CAMPEP_0184696454 /NCGR_PEP_ID=MMETSP0313-20130426/3740_1 /TAXON_ID=2792 /ORGANISM="Porphyridium aerugineum, Strain SAG 1380-2" /LENGTH=484 /DNA_ID=CAMNT_0027155081 /DNA_START=358 /DNA_END=1812 /DNA_ORIENTATION=+
MTGFMEKWSQRIHRNMFISAHPLHGAGKYGFSGKRALPDVFTANPSLINNPEPKTINASEWNVSSLLHELQAGSASRFGRRTSRKVLPKILYIFLHLHKTAGNNLKQHLFAFAKKNQLALYHTCRPSKVQVSTLGRIFFNRKPKNPHKDFDCNLHEFALEMNDSERHGLDMLVGHQYFGSHTLIPDSLGAYFTFVRHPLTRKISHFGHFEVSDEDSNSSVSILNLTTSETDNMNESHNTVQLFRQSYRRTHIPVSQQLLHSQALNHYLLERNLNYMTKRLAGLGSSLLFPKVSETGRMWNHWLFSSDFGMDMHDYLIDTVPEIASHAVQLAEEHLRRHFFFVGLQERYEESVCILVNMLNHEMVYEDVLKSMELQGQSAFEAALHLRSLRKPVEFQLELRKVLRTHVNRRKTRSQEVAENLDRKLVTKVLNAERLDLHIYHVAEEMFLHNLERFPECQADHIDLGPPPKQPSHNNHHLHNQDSP